ncbi:MAG: hypothetical protein RR561_02495 [Peptostreptococcus sp.]|uniref:hypothetical protein n=1 Tax=Peptostreptococcus sp. TaxID=1262 RepID=UPI002FC6200D
MLNEKWKNRLGVAVIFLAIMKYYGVYFGFSNFSKYFMLISLVLSTVLIISNRKQYNIVHIGFLLLAGLQFVISKNITVVYTYYLCLALYAADFRVIVKWFTITNAVLFSIYLAMNVVGIHPTEYLEGRNDFGFGNPNTAFISMFLIWSAYFYYVYNKKRKIDYILLFALIFLMYTQTTTRTGLLTAVMTILAFIILENMDLSKKYARIFVSSFPVLMSLLSLVIAIFLSDNYFFNSVLSHRPLYWHSYVMHPSRGINLFGYASNIRDILFTQRMPLDSGYIWSLYSSGILVYTALIAMMCYTLYQLCKKDKKAEILLIVSLLIYCFAESIMLDLATNIGLVLIVGGVSNLSLENIKNMKLRVKSKKTV